MADGDMNKDDWLKMTYQKKRRKRPRTKAVRCDLKNKLETAILSSEAKVLNLLIPSVDDETVSAPFSDVLKQLQLDQLPEIKALTKDAIKRISNVTRVFKICEENGALIISVDKRVCSSSNEKTVYVDNLPKACSEARLKRRAAMFGTVVSIVLPKITRIQWQIGSSFNSGFGFVQFASKTAAKKFCRKYAVNSRLKRPKHMQKRKHGTKAQKGISDPKKDNLSSGDVNLEKEEENSQVPLEIEAMESDSSSNVHSRKRPAPIDTSDRLDKELGVQPPAEKRRKRFTTSMSVEDSGNDTENDTTKFSNDLTKQKKGKKRHRRRRHKPDQERSKEGRVSDLTRLFHRIQVFSLKQYKELRAEYLKLQKERMAGLKKELSLKTSENSTKLIPVSCKRISPTDKKADGKRKKRKRVRGREKLKSKAERTKQKSFVN